MRFLKGKSMKTMHLKSEDLAVRWDVKESTLGQWRWFGKGPPFLKLESLILYRMKDIEHFEDLAIQHLEDGQNDEVFSQIRLENQKKEHTGMSP